MARRFGLPIVVLLIATVFWWMDRSADRDDTTSAPDLHTPAVTAEEFVGDTSVESWQRVEDFEKELVLFESVFWEPTDTTSLRKLIRETSLVKGKTVFEIGTGSGLVSLVCLKAGATRVVASDINPNAVRNAVHNAQRLGLLDKFEVRRVSRRSPGAWTVLREDEKFDLIISNPPWEDSVPDQVKDFALYDPGFGLLTSLLSGAKERLKPGGRMLLAYGCVTAIRKIEELAPKHGFTVKRLDDRQLEGMDEVFLPGMLLELTPE